MNELIKVQIGHVEVYLFIIIHTIFGTFLDYIYIFGLYFWDEYLGLGLNLYVSICICRVTILDSVLSMCR